MKEDTVINHMKKVVPEAADRLQNHCKQIKDEIGIVKTNIRQTAASIDMQYVQSCIEEKTEVKEIYFSQNENIAFWECGLFLKAGEKNGTTIVGVKAYIDGVMRTDHIMVTVNNGKFVSIMFEKH